MDKLQHKTLQQSEAAVLLPGLADPTVAGRASRVHLNPMRPPPPTDHLCRWTPESFEEAMGEQQVCVVAGVGPEGTGAAVVRLRRRSALWPSRWLAAWHRRALTTTRLLTILLLGTTSYAGAQFTTEMAIPSTLAGPHFTLTIEDTARNFFPGVVGNLPSTTYGYNSMDYLGPTLIFNKGETVSFDITNNTGTDDVTVHWHGFHLPAIWDGGPQNSFASGETWSPIFEVVQNASTMWYHSHIHGETARQVGRGMAGLIIINDGVESLLDLPRTYGEDDIPVILQDKLFDIDGALTDQALGEIMVLNGTPEPYVDVPAQVVRFRFLNASVERVYNLGFEDDRSFYQIGTDGGLLEAPVSLARVVVAPGERVEVLFDLTDEDVDNEIYLKSYSTEFGGTVAGSCNDGPACGDGPLDNTDFNFLKMVVVSQTADPVISIPGSLVEIDFLDEAELDETRIKQLLGPAFPGAPFTINGGSFDMDVINDYVPVGNMEIWQFENLSELGHPMHIHDVQFNILRVDGVPPAANLTGWKDTVLVYPGEVVEVLAEFTDFVDKSYTYMMHCHSLNHEDAGMMEQFVIVPASHLVLSNDTLSTEAVYEACLSITVGPDLFITGDVGGVTIRAPEIIFVEEVGVSGVTVFDNSVPADCP